MREIFEAEERTDHKGILPAKDRIKQYKTKNIRRNIPSAFPNANQQTRLMSGMIKSTQDFKGLQPPVSAKEDKIRPVTAAASNFGMSEAPTAFTAGQNSSAANLGLKNRAISLSRFSKFEETEKAAQAYPYNVFYTSNEPTVYRKENRFEGKSSYNFYYPTGEMHEQELEQIWFDDRNKELADKRREEEAK
jgi:hypothetical protein